MLRRFSQFWGNESLERSAAGFDFRILDATGDPDDVEPHVHEDAHFVFVLAGNYVSSAKDAPPASSAPILIDNPIGTAHRDHFLHGRGRFLAISVPTDHAREGKAQTLRDMTSIADMHRLVGELHLSDTQLPVDEIAMQLASRHCAPITSQSRPDWLDRSYQMVMEEQPAELTLAALSADAKVHPVYLARCFRRHFGRTAGQLLRARQFERACQMLLNRERSLADIAYRLGFSDQAHFTHMFRQHAGCTPGWWRRQAIEQV